MEVTFNPTKNKEGKVLAFAAVEVTDGIVVRGFRIVDGGKGVFAAVPSQGSTLDGKTRYYNQVVFADSEQKERFLAELLEDYYRWLKTRDSMEQGPVVEMTAGNTGRDESVPPF
jgi:DNA-binding cell septation regulator SpoVG